MAELTPKENMIRVLKHQIPERIPNLLKDTISYLPPEVAERAPGDGSIAQKLGGTGYDWFGIHWTFQPHAGASMVSHEYPPLLEDITQWKEVVKFPDLDAIDWAAIAERDKDKFDPQKLCTITLLNGMFERLHALMGMEEACCALLLEPEATYEFFGAVADHKIKLMDKLVTHFPVDQIELHDDWGHHTNAFFGADTWEELLAPHIKRIVAFAKEKDVFLRFHSCGKVESLIPSMVEAGIDHWSSAQTINDIENIIKNYGDRLVLTGGMDWEELKKPGITKEEAKAIVTDKVLKLCRGGALIPFGGSSVPLVNPVLEEILSEQKDFFKNPENCKLPV